MDLISGCPFWPIQDGLIASYPILKTDLSCDVVVVGGGITGALVADFVARAGFDVVLLDRRDVACGSTATSTALLLYEIDKDLFELIDLIGEDDAVRAYRCCQEAIGKVEDIVRELDDDCQFMHRQSLYLASDEEGLDILRQEYSARRRHGFKVDFLSERKLRELSSLQNPAALLSSEAAELDSYRFAHCLLKRASSNGARIFDRTQVDRYEEDENGVILTTDRGCRVRSKYVVWATGYEAQPHLKQKIVTLKSTYVIISEPMTNWDGWPRDCLLWETARPYIYLRTTADGRVMIGGEDILFKNAKLRDRLIDQKSNILRERFLEMFPQMEFDIAYSWAGTFGETKDGLAYIGSTPEYPRTFFALGFGGNGITYSVLAAEIIRDALQGRTHPDAPLFRFDR